jgi:hypothetical protein
MEARVRAMSRLAFVIVAAAGMAACAFPGTNGPVVNEHHEVDRGAATAAKVSLDMTAGDLEVRAGATKLLEGDFSFNVPSLKPEIQYAVAGGTGTLKVSQGSNSGGSENVWRVSLDDKTPVDLEITLGAGDAKLTLGRLNLQNLSIRLGAGDLDVDLRGTPAKSYSVKVQAGAGDTTILLPASVGISASTSGLLGDSNVSGLEKRDGRWVNTQAANSAVTVDVQVQHAIGDLKLRAE